jgi:hypothetical protein
MLSQRLRQRAAEEGGGLIEDGKRHVAGAADLPARRQAAAAAIEMGKGSGNAHLVAEEDTDDCAVGHEGHQLLRLFQERELPAVDKAALRTQSRDMPRLQPAA